MNADKNEIARDYAIQAAPGRLRLLFTTALCCDVAGVLVRDLLVQGFLIL